MKKLKHYRSTLEHIRRVQDNMLRLIELIHASEEMRRLIDRFNSVFQYPLSQEDLIDELYTRLYYHDQSKLSIEEWPGFYEANHGDKLKNLDYGSPEYMEQLDSVLGPALKHHYELNDHHPEYWQNWRFQMTVPAFLEMLCDWEAATHRHKTGDIYKSIVINEKRFMYSSNFTPNMKKFFDLMLAKPVEA